MSFLILFRTIQVFLPYQSQ